MAEGGSAALFGCPSVLLLSRLFGLPPAAILSSASPGTTGFDVVGSWGWSRVEVRAASLKTRNKISAKSNADFHTYELAV
jgi:hypothetical protein